MKTIKDIGSKRDLKRKESLGRERDSKGTPCNPGPLIPLVQIPDWFLYLFAVPAEPLKWIFSNTSFAISFRSLVVFFNSSRTRVKSKAEESYSTISLNAPWIEQVAHKEESFYYIPSLFITAKRLLYSFNDFSQWVVRYATTILWYISRSKRW